MQTDGPVVIALDGTTHSAGTLAWGMAEAVRRRASVVLTQVVGTPWQVGAWATYPVMDAQALNDRATVTAYLTQQQHREQARHPRMDIGTRLLDGSVVRELRGLSDAAQLIVVGDCRSVKTGRSSGLGARLAARARCPVAVAPDA